MSLLWSADQDRPAFFTAAGGEASLLDIYGAARDASLYVDNTFAAEAAVEEAYRRRNAQIFDLTGEKLANPMLTGLQWAPEAYLGGISVDGRAVDTDPASIRARQIASWRGQVRALAERRPELAGELLPGRSIEDEALSISRDADERFSRLAGSRGGAGAWLAAFIGGGAGALRDPVQVSTFALGGGPGAARTTFGRIMMTAGTEAAVNTGVEAALQPIVQNYRAKAGIESGFDLALQNVVFAGLLGGVLGAGGRGLYELLSRGGASPARALAAAAGDLPPALKTELDAVLPATVAGIRQALPPAVRGAIDQAEAIDHLDTTRPAAVSIETHDRNVAAAGRADATGEPPIFVPDEAQVQRIAERLAPSPEKAGKQPLSLTEFLIARGGILDEGGELKAMDARELTKNRARAGGRGRAAVPDRRMPLDRAREAAEEAGYIGGPEGGTTVRDLLEAIDRESRGERIYSREDLALVLEADGADAQRAQVEAAISELAAIAGPGIDDALIEAAARRVLVDGETPDDALERVLVRAEMDGPAGPDMVRMYHGGEPTDAAGALWFSSQLSYAEAYAAKSDGRVWYIDVPADHPLIAPEYPEQSIAAGFHRNVELPAELASRRKLLPTEPIPGWSDAELEAMAARMPEPEAMNGGPFDDPGSIPDELGYADQTGPFAPSWDAEQVKGDWSAGVELLKKHQAGEVRGLLSHPATGPIDVVWGHYDPETGIGAGLAKILAKHGNAANDIPQLLAGMTAKQEARAGRVELQSAEGHATVRLDYDNQAKTWLLTAYRFDRRTGETPDRSGGHQAGGHSSPASTAGQNIDPGDSTSNTNAAVERLMAERAEREMTVPWGDGEIRLADLMDEIQRDEAMADAVRSCPI